MKDKSWSGILAITIPGFCLKEVYTLLEQNLRYQVHGKNHVIRIPLKNREVPQAHIAFPERWVRQCFEGQRYPRFHIYFEIPNQPESCDLEDQLTVVANLHCDWQEHEMEKDAYGLKRCKDEANRIKRAFGGRGSFVAKSKETEHARV